MHRIYPIINLESSDELDIQFIAKVLTTLCPEYLQLRMKKSSTEDIVKTADKIIKIRNDLGVKTKIFINDSVEAAVKSCADGVHIGQEDDSFEKIKARYPLLKIGLSTHNTEQVEKASLLDLEYIGFGPVFKTSTKKDHSPVVGNIVEKAVLLSRHSVVFIGGINKKNIESLPQSDNIMYAVVSALNEFL